MVEVYKFGGTCTSTKENIRKIVDLVTRSEKPICVTLSAAYGVTSRLINLLDTRYQEHNVSETIIFLKEIVSILGVELAANMLEVIFLDINGNVTPEHGTIVKGIT